MKMLCALSCAALCAGGAALAAERLYFAADSLRGTLARDHQPRAVYFSGRHERTYMTYMDHNFDARVTFYDHKTMRWAKPVRVDDCRTRDGHNAPNLLITRDGVLHLFYGCHGHPAKYARSESPEDISEWRTGMEVGSRATYTYAVQTANGDILVFYRFGGAGRRSPLKVHRSTDGGKSWDDGAVILDYGGKSWVKIRDTLYDPASDRIHLALWEGNHNYWNVYHAAYDVGKRRVFAINGADLGELATKEELVANGARLEGKNGSRTDLDMVLHGGKPYFVLRNASAKREYFAEWDGEKLVRRRIPRALVEGMKGYELYTKDGVRFELYGIKVTDPPTEFSGGDLLLWTSPDKGETWGQPKVLIDRRKFGHGLCGVNLALQYEGKGAFVFFQEEWKERSEDLPKHRGSILDDAPFRFNKRLYALDGEYNILPDRD